MFVSDKFYTDPGNHEITAKFGVLILGFLHEDGDCIDCKG